MHRNKMTSRRLLRAVLLAELALLPVALTGCGNVGMPQPPSLKLPTPVKDLAAERAGSIVQLHWTMPKETTDGLALKGTQTVKVCRSVGAPTVKEHCDKVATFSAAPNTTASAQDTLPAALTSGEAHLLTYRVEVLNAERRSAGLSNRAFVAGGAAPAMINAFSATTTQQGVMLRWQAASKGTTTQLLVTRELLEKPAAEHAARKDSQLNSRNVEPVKQLLRIAVPDGNDPGQALDVNARFGSTYRYTIQRVEQLTVGSQQVELRGPLSSPVTLAVQDTFPPAAPTGLDAVLVPAAAGSAGNSSAYSVDMSWTPNTEPDLAGYLVYRQDETSNNAPVPLNSRATLAVAPTFQDAAVQPGHRYAYRISAVDQAGNESGHSTPVELAVPPAQ